MRLLLSHSSRIITQGASDDGTTPRNAEIPLAAVVFVLREAIYAFPNGSTRDEYLQWLRKMNEITDNAFALGVQIANGVRKLGIRKVPWVIHRFKALYAKYLEDSVSFDLRTILIYEARDCPDHVTGENVRACFGDSNFHIDLQWMSDLVRLWNIEREKKSWPPLTLDTTPYEGRCVGLSSNGIEAADSPVRPSSPPIWPEKEPVRDPVIKPVPIPKSSAKGKEVDRTAIAPATSSKRERPLDTHYDHTIEDSPDEIIEIASSEGSSAPPTPSRRGTRPRTPSKDPVPRVVAKSSSRRPTKRVRKSMTLQLALNTQPSTSAAIAQPEPLPSLVSDTINDLAMVDVEADQKIIIVFEDCIDGGIKMTVDGVYLVPEESERELFPNRYIMNSTSGILWKGPSLLPYIFWAHIPVDENLDVLQQALMACYSCAIMGFPCYRLLKISICCVRCRHFRMGCSLSFHKDNHSIQNPYGHMLARYTLCWQIHRLRYNGNFIVLNHDYTGYNFMPGVTQGYMPGHRSGNRDEHDATAKREYDELRKKTSWDECWVGENYVEARSTWEALAQKPPLRGFTEQVLARTPSIGTLLPSNIKSTLQWYYEELSKTDSLFKIVPYPVARVASPTSDTPAVDATLAGNATPAAHVTFASTPIPAATPITATTPIRANTPALAATPPAAAAATSEPAATPVPANTPLSPITPLSAPIPIAANTLASAHSPLPTTQLAPTLSRIPALEPSLAVNSTNISEPTTAVEPAFAHGDLASTLDAPLAVDVVSSISTTTTDVSHSSTDDLPSPSKRHLTIASHLSTGTALPDSTASVAGSSLQAPSILPPEQGGASLSVEFNVPAPITDSGIDYDLKVTMTGANTDEKDDEDAEGSIDDDKEGSAPLQTEQADPSLPPVNIDVEVVEMNERQHESFHPPPDHGTDIDMILDDYNPPLSQSLSHMAGQDDDSILPGPAELESQDVTTPALPVSSQARLHTVSPLPPSAPNHPSGSNIHDVDIPSVLTWKDQVTGYNVRILDGQLKQIQSGPLPYREPPPPSISERDDLTSSNPSPNSNILPILAEELMELKEMIHELASRLEIVEAKNEENSAELTVTREQLIESRAQVSLLSSQLMTQNDKAYLMLSKKLDDWHNVEHAAIRSTVTSSFAQVLRGHMQTRPNSLTSVASLFETDPPLPSTISPQRLNTRRISDRQVESLSDAFLGSILTDPSGVLASVPVSPITSHHPPNSLNGIRSTTSNVAGPSRLSDGRPTSP